MAHGRDDELVEKVARAIWDTEDWGAEFCELPVAVQHRYQEKATAALAVARPVIREECAKVAEETVAYSSGQAVIRQNIAAAIRAME
jgi:hypothetical protein